MAFFKQKKRLKDTRSFFFGGGKEAGNSNTSCQVTQHRNVDIEEKVHS